MHYKTNILIIRKNIEQEYKAGIISRRTSLRPLKNKNELIMILKVIFNENTNITKKILSMIAHNNLTFQPPWISPRASIMLQPDELGPVFAFYSIPCYILAKQLTYWYKRVNLIVQ